MTERFRDYLGEIGVADSMMQRIEEVHGFFSQVCPEPITGMFVSDFITEDNSREYESLWFFSDTYCMEAHEFVTTDHFDLAVLKNSVLRWAIRKQHYDFAEAEERSRAHLEINLGGNILGSLKASSQNCDYLRDVFLHYVVPNVKS